MTKNDDDIQANIHFHTAHAINEYLGKLRFKNDKLLV